MTFTFDPKADYYEMFEATDRSVTSTLYDLMDDVEDYDEFLGLLRDGRYPIDPDAPLKPELHKLKERARQNTEAEAEH